MSNVTIFTVAKGQIEGARRGRLTLPGRAEIQTPNYIANTSRGVVPHLTQDTLSRDTAINGLYTSFEDFIEKASQIPPVLEYVSKTGRSLRDYLAVPDDRLLILGARRIPPVVPPPATSNTDTEIAVSTSIGIRHLEADYYAECVEALTPDVIVGLADIPVGRVLAAKRIDKATDRSIDWVATHLDARSCSKNAYFASLLPVSCANQQYYVDSLVDEHIKSLDGLAIYSIDSLADLHSQLIKLPRLDLTEASTPLQTLQNIRAGVDLLVLPFLDVTTDAGLALTFSFPRPKGAAEEVSPLGVDMWDISHATDVSALSNGCACYACTKHHRAYVQHLLNAKEMLGWVLLQVHNNHIMSLFFVAIRASIDANTFDNDIEAFSAAYDPTFPSKTGQGPRVRGYQRRSERPAEPKINPSAFKKYKDDPKPKPARSTVPKVASGLPDDFDIGLLDSNLSIQD